MEDPINICDNVQVTEMQAATEKGHLYNSDHEQEIPTQAETDSRKGN